MTFPQFLMLLPLAFLLRATSAGDLMVEEVDDEIRIETPHPKARQKQ